MKDYKLFVAGPVNAEKDIKKKFPFPEIGHRESEFENLYGSVKKKLLKAFGVKAKDYSVTILGGSGTSGMESILSSVCGRDDTLIISNGAFGERMEEIMGIYELYGCRAVCDWGEPIDLELLEEKLKENNFSIKNVAMVHMETSTGMLNPVTEVGKLCKKYKKNFIVDAVCAFGGEDVNVVRDNIDFLFTSTNKGIGGPPVLSIVLAKNKSMRKIKYKRTMYLDLKRYFDYSKKNQTPFTPQIPLFYIMDMTLDDILKEGMKNRIKRYEENGVVMKLGLIALGLDLYLDSHHSNLMVNVMLPKNKTYKQIHDSLKKKGYIIYPGKGQLANKVFHIANIGTLTCVDINEFLKVLKVVLK